ncbi:MAG: hypothetical protein ACFFDW_09630, partial [Candidatus Thorarchaeota archaeon]
MKRRTTLFLITIILVSTGLGITSLSKTNSMLWDDGKKTNLSTTTGDITFPFEKTFHIGDDNYWNMSDLLDVNHTLENIPSFEGAGITAYEGDDAIPGISATMYLVRVELLNATIYDDHDIANDGEIYFNSTINGNFTRTENEGVEDIDTIDVNLVGFHAWCFSLDISIEVWDDDTYPDPDDALGDYHFQTTSPSSQIINTLTDIGDARLWIEIEVLDTVTGVTAEQLADGCKPYLYFCDETTKTEEANETYSRVLTGYDSDKGKNVICVQFIYYWDKEYFPIPVNSQFHQYDFEEFLIFIDPADILHPYRYVFDDGSYVSNTYSSRIAIWEYSTTTDILNTEAYISEELTQLLGYNYTTNYKIFDLGDATNELRTGLAGIDTMNILVQTSFHNFQEGPPGTFDICTTELGYNYSLSILNDSKIREFFRIHYGAFEEGLWWISYIGKDTPKVHPFTFDIMNPFVFPYVINGYPNVVDNIDLFQKANKNFINYEYSIDITPAFLVKARYKITAPDTVQPGEEFDATVELQILEDETEIALFYDLYLNATLKALFYSSNYQFTTEGKYSVNIPVKTLRMLMAFMGYYPYYGFDMLDVDKSGFLTLDHFSLSPQLLGTIMMTNASLHLWDLFVDTFDDALTTKQLNVLGYFMEAIDLKMGAGFFGYTTGNISTSNDAIGVMDATDFEFDGDVMSKEVTITVADSITSGQTFNIVLDDLAYIFQMLADWSLEIDFGPIISLLAPQYEQMVFDIGTFPNISWTSEDSEQTSISTVTKTI